MDRDTIAVFFMSFGLALVVATLARGMVNTVNGEMTGLKFKEQYIGWRFLKLFKRTISRDTCYGVRIARLKLMISFS